MTLQYFSSPTHSQALNSTELREQFLLTNIFQPGKLELRVTDLDRAIIGGVVPLGDSIQLANHEALKAKYFLERRELGVLNTGGAGKITVGREVFPLGNRDVLYIGRGSETVSFESADAKNPAKFYLISYPAHQSYPVALVRAADASRTDLGNFEQANKRSIFRYIHLEGTRSSQLVMGVTVLAPGSVWNTMPAHTHYRRTEVYLYFDLPTDAFVVHLFGEPDETRHLIVRDGEVALSPGWSIHSGCGTTNYSFCWAMGGENQDYADMQPVPMNSLR